MLIFMTKLCQLYLANIAVRNRRLWCKTYM